MSIKAQYGEPWTLEDGGHRIKLAKEMRANAPILNARSVACVNALAGVPDDALDKVPYLVEAYLRARSSGDIITIAVKP